MSATIEKSLFFKSYDDISNVKSVARQLIESSTLLQSSIQYEFNSIDEDWEDFLADIQQLHSMITPTAIMLKHKVMLSPPEMDNTGGQV